jgi:drug/metabolite transporter (DMT)-like permease
MKPDTRGILYLLTAGLCYSIMVIFVRVLAKEIPPFSQVFLRYLIALSVSIFVFRSKKIDWKLKSKKEYFILFIMGFFGYGLTNLLFTLGVINTSLANAEFIFSTSVVITPLLGFLLIREKLSVNTIVSILSVSLGSFLLFNPGINGNFIGGLFSIGAALCNSIYMIGSRKLKNYSSSVLMIYSTFLGAISSGIFSLIWENKFYISSMGINQFSLYNLSPLVIFTIFIFGFDNFAAWTLLNKGLQKVKAGTASIILLIEPVIATIIGFFIYSELLRLVNYAGILLITLGILIAAGEMRNKLV